MVWTLFKKAQRRLGKKCATLEVEGPRQRGRGKQKVVAMDVNDLLLKLSDDVDGPS